MSLILLFDEAVKATTPLACNALMAAAPAMLKAVEVSQSAVKTVDLSPDSY